MHRNLDLKVLYFGTPVVLISSRNADGTPNLAPMSSAWWLGDRCLLGLGDSSRTSANLLRERECVLNLADTRLVGAVDRIALLTGTPEVPPFKRQRGYRYEPDKFGAAGLTPQPSEVVSPPRVLECPIQLEGEVLAAHRIGGPDGTGSAIEVAVRRVHVQEELVIPGTDHVDPVKWDPLLMKFCEFFGGAGRTCTRPGWPAAGGCRTPAPASRPPPRERLRRAGRAGAE
jgi:flavin reductase (DIM6/NTAB) family NADH-FMN oxidoreductase RutF